MKLQNIPKNIYKYFTPLMHLLYVTNFIMINEKILFLQRMKHDHIVNETFIDLVIQVTRQS